MKLKYFLRGLGIGVVVTTIILSIAHASADKSMSDADVIERAKELGMVYDSLFDGTKESTGNESTESEGTEAESTEAGTTESNTAEGENAGSEPSEGTSEQVETESAQNQSTETESESTEAQSSSESASSENTSTEEPAIAETTTAETTTEPTTADTVKEIVTETDENGVITFQLEVVRGMKSAEVAALVEKAGIVSSAKELDAFLIAGDYDNQINIGIFTINSEMTYEDIASIITGK